MSTEHPNVFISYSWEDDEHKEWVKDLADRLLSDGINATIDKYDLSAADRLPHFMEESISNADFVLIICTPKYKEKSDNRTGGVGYEGHIISGELFLGGHERKFIPVLRKGTFKESIPRSLTSKLFIDLTEGKHYEDNYRDLLTTLYGAKNKPPIGKRPAYIQPYPQTVTQSVEENEPIHIMGIITNEVTVPKMDGTRGSALYKIPFRLSKRPSELWRKIFIATWNSPPRFTTRHRPGIASIFGDKIILDGTTIEEVRDYHRETLVLCVDIANKKEQEIIEQERIRKENEEMRKNQHYNNVNSIADEIIF